MPLIDRETVQKITDTADIVEVVGDYVHLVRRGANYMGLCPFHNERTPSFSVNKRKNFCYCFSCKQGGSPVNFIMKKEGLSYHEALLHLARKYGIEVKERELTDDERKEQTERESMFVANEWAMNIMKENLFNTEEGRNIGLSYFFRQREITQEAAEAFRLGYALDNSSALVSAAKKAGFDQEILYKTGLIGKSQDVRFYDKYRGRVIFPILNTAGKVVGFGGRTLKNDRAKYINSPESEIYKKSNELYGIFQARASIGKEDKCFLVEGYFDVIGMWQSGMKNVVASSGTALTDGQIALIHRFTENITLIYDGDRAGIKAALRGVDMLLHNKMKVKVLLLPDGHDPDSFARTHTPEQFREFVNRNETDVITFKATVLLKDMESDPQSRIAAVQDMVTTLAHISDHIARDIYIQECSRLMKVPEATILKEVVKKRNELIEQWRKSRYHREVDDVAPVDTKDSPIEKPEVAVPAKVSRLTPLYPLEHRLMEFIIKYGYLPFCNATDVEEPEGAVASENTHESGDEKWWDVIDYISIELELDNIKFSVPVFSRIFSILKNLKSGFILLREKKIEEIKLKGEELKRNGYSEIASQNLSMSEIQKAEKKLMDSVEAFVRNELYDFEKHYPARILSSHEDDEIREVSTELAVEVHQLSNIYSRDNNLVETEEDRLFLLVPRAINELKTEILNLKMKDLVIRLSEASNNGDSELESRIQLEINEIMQFRATLAKNLGERTISPWKRN